jgi:hypothetical protein
MSVHEFEQAQQKALPKDDLTPYRGQWVALRDGHVVASDVDAVAVRDNPVVTSEDTLLPVPPGGEGVVHIL